MNSPRDFSPGPGDSSEKILPHRQRKFISLRRKSDVAIFVATLGFFAFSTGVLVYKFFWEEPAAEVSPKPSPPSLEIKSVAPPLPLAPQIPKNDISSAPKTLLSVKPAPLPPNRPAKVTPAPPIISKGGPIYRPLESGRPWQIVSQGESKIQKDVSKAQGKTVLTLVFDLGKNGGGVFQSLDLDMSSFQVLKMTARASADIEVDVRFTDAGGAVYYGTRSVKEKDGWNLVSFQWREFRSRVGGKLNWKHITRLDFILRPASKTAKGKFLIKDMELTP